MESARGPAPHWHAASRARRPAAGLRVRHGHGGSDSVAVSLSVDSESDGARAVAYLLVPPFEVPWQVRVTSESLRLA